jgi:putative tryptophan/tyrosine transport system substrate-binding protein
MGRALALAILAVCLAAALPASAQVKRIGYLQGAATSRVAPFKDALRQLGHVEGKSYVLEFRSADGNYGRLPALAAELAGMKVDVILTDGGTPGINAARAATRDIPIVFLFVADPVAQGIVSSLARPGGNITGISVQHPEFAPKTLELFRQILPGAKRVAVLNNPANASLPRVLGEVKAAAAALALDVEVVDAAAPSEFEKAFAAVERSGAAGLMILRDVLFTAQARRLSTLASRHRIPTMGGDAVFPESGALASYGPNSPDMVRRGAVLVDRILKGAKPADLPVEQPQKFDLVINAGTAKALGIAIPAPVLLRADRVID